MSTIILEIASPNKKITFYGSDGRKIMKCGSAMFSFWGKSSDSDIDITQGSFLNASTTLTIALSVAAGVLGVILVLVIMFIIWKL